jgi:hypothetical protein
MQIICMIVLVFMNGAYLFISFNMESIVAATSEEATMEITVTSTAAEVEFDPADILDLDIFDFDVEGLASGNSDPQAVSSRRTKDLAK